LLKDRGKLGTRKFRRLNLQVPWEGIKGGERAHDWGFNEADLYCVSPGGTNINNRENAGTKFW